MTCTYETCLIVIDKGFRAVIRERSVTSALRQRNWIAEITHQMFSIHTTPEEFKTQQSLSKIDI